MISAKLTKGIFLPKPAKSSKVLKPWRFMMPIVMNASAVVMPPIRKKYRFPAKPRRGDAGDGDEVVADVCDADVCDHAFNVVLNQRKDVSDYHG